MILNRQKFNDSKLKYNNTIFLHISPIVLSMYFLRIAFKEHFIHLYNMTEIF